MEYIKLGQTGLEVSRICLGCMTYGVPERGAHPWTLNEAASRPLLQQAVEAGINFFDTSNSYSSGSSEEITGRALRDFVRRDEVVVATKCFYPWRRGPNGGGLSRKAIFEAAEASLQRLGMDYIDLYQIHRWDYDTPIAETMEALDNLVRSGKVRYIGASSMWAWQFCKSLHTGRTRFVSMQNHYNLLYREEEREMIPLCASEGIAVIPWSPLARGKLTRAWDEATYRTETDEFGKTLYKAAVDTDRRIVERVGDIASHRGVSRAQVALAWLLGKSYVTAPIVGASKPGHIDDAVSALALRLTREEIASLEDPYVPHPVQGFR